MDHDRIADRFLASLAPYDGPKGTVEARDGQIDPVAQRVRAEVRERAYRRVLYPWRGEADR